MTSEVLMLNKDAVVIAADSAVTTGRDPHPRYSKAANKIFDLSFHGNVAVTIFAAAEIDSVPWELALKQFRQQDIKNPQRPKLRDYVDALTAYLEANDRLFPVALRSDLLNKRLFQAAIYVLGLVEGSFPDFVDQSQEAATRSAAWEDGSAAVAKRLAAAGYQAPLTDAVHHDILAQSAAFQAELAVAIAPHDKYLHADVVQLTQLAIEALVKWPTEFLNSTGLIFAGYGADDIFPSFISVYAYGHVGGTFLWADSNSYAITHSNDAWIQPFAQSAMIDRFTDGFDYKLGKIIENGSMDSFQAVVADLKASGLAIQDAVSDPVIEKRHEEFMQNWKQKNWEANFHPLRRVLNSLSVPEMGHLAESLLVLEALRERVTSPSESVGGPIDVAVITKAEGLLWLKRKHFFDSQLNGRYLNRVESCYS